MWSDIVRIRQRIGDGRELVVSSASRTTLVILASVASLVGSSSYAINRSLSLAGGDWAWNASLRYIILIPMLGGLLAARRGGINHLSHLLGHLHRHLWLWCVIGTLGSGIFYSGICFAIANAPSWIVASTWQTTLICSLLILQFFGYKVGGLTYVAMGLILVSAILINVRQVSEIEAQLRFLAPFGAVLCSSVMYPLANQLIATAKAGGISSINANEIGIFSNPFACVFLSAIGSIPFWVVLLVWKAPPPPSYGQIASTAVVAMLSGVISTSLFLFARNSSPDATTISAVDATQATQVIFALFLEHLLSGTRWPDVYQWFGIAGITSGILIIAVRRTAKRRA